MKAVRCWGTLSLLLVLSGSAGAADSIEKPFRAVPAAWPGPARTVWVGTPRPDGSSCVVGEPGPGVDDLADYINPTSGPDAYYVLLSPETCPACGASEARALDVVHIELVFPVVCSQPTVISIVGATGSGACLEPDTNVVISPAMAVDLTPDIGSVTNFAVPLPVGVKIGSAAFLCVKFKEFPTECASVSDRPRLRITNSCASCQVYNDYYSIGLGGIRRADMCASGITGRLVFYVTSTQCTVPVVSRSWGALKHHYR